MGHPVVRLALFAAVELRHAIRAASQRLATRACNGTAISTLDCVRHGFFASSRLLKAWTEISLNASGRDQVMSGTLNVLGILEADDE